MFSNKVIDKSFVLMNADISLAICPLMLEEVNGILQASIPMGLSLPIPLFHPELSVKQTRALEDFVFDEIKARMVKNNVSRLFVKADGMSVGFENLEDQMLSRFGALDISSHHHIINLGLKDDVIWQEFRHSSKSIINRGLKTYEFKVYDKSNYSDEIGERHMLLHHKTSGRITRPKITFEKMYSWIYNDSGLMFEQSLNGQVVQMIFVALGKKTAVGASAADDPEIEIVVPMTHSINFYIFQETKRRGIQYYDLGETAFRSNLHQIFTPKEMKINYFKRGFSDQSFPLKRWIWFTDQKEEIKYLDERLKIYKKFMLE